MTGDIGLTQLLSRFVEKPWGKKDIPSQFRSFGEAERVGEIWFEDPRPGDVPSKLLVKYLFTSENLSIQVHPSDAMARLLGFAGGKDEAWFILDAMPSATIAMGLRSSLDKDELRRAALNGTIETLVDWHPVAAGDFYYSAAGTVHAIGAGVTLIEVQENNDVTFRLYDYGRPRELNIDLAVSAANIESRPQLADAELLSNGREILSRGKKLVLERWFGERSAIVAAHENDPLWIVPISGRIAADQLVLSPGTVWLAESLVRIHVEEGEMLLAYPGDTVRVEIP